MATTAAIIEGMNILSTYYSDKGAYKVGAEHDQIYMFATEEPVSEDDIKRLRELGWFQEFIDHEDGDEYDPGESWAIYV